MRYIIRFICRLFIGERTRQPSQRYQADLIISSENTYKRQALSESDVKELVEGFPQAKVTWVIDGDTAEVSIGWSKLRIRLDSIDCPEGGQQWGDTATYGLIKLIGGRSVHLEVHGLDPHGRTLATIYVRHANGVEWINVNERMVMLGHAWVMRKFYDHLTLDRREKLNRLENWARSRKVGLWRGQNPIPPWRWRSAESKNSNTIKR